MITKAAGASTSRRIWLLAALVALWVLIMGLSLQKLYHYDYQAGAISESAEPVTAPRTRGVPHLLMFVNPGCPCTRASIAQLGRILAEVGPDNLTADILFVVPSGAHDAAEWEQSDLWKMVQRLPGARALLDRDGLEAQRFGAKTSSHIELLNGETGRSMFRGGITDGRGHEGENPGHKAVVQYVRTRQVSRTQTPVFGCEL